MTARFRLALATVLATAAAFGQPAAFDDVFADSTLRIDYYHAANGDSARFTLDALTVEGAWAGNPATAVQPFDLGRYRVRVLDMEHGTLHFSQGFGSLAGEYRTTPMAREGRWRTFHESVRIPLPQRPVRVVLDDSDRANRYVPVAEWRVDPGSPAVRRESPDRGDRIIPLVTGPELHRAVDIVILAEGYTAAEADSFVADLERHVGYLFDWEPWSAFRERFTVTGIFRPSLDSGPDEPLAGHFRRTALDVTFNSLGSPRYMMTESNRAMREMAAQVPYDALIVLVNTDRYGGGGIFNCYTTVAADNPWPEHMLHHEFAHGFAGLADEYYTSDVAYDTFYEPGVEPREANLTALLDPEALKWKSLVSPGVAIPTDWNRAAYDTLDRRRSRLRGEMHVVVDSLITGGYPKAVVDSASTDYQAREQALADSIKRFFLEHPLRGKVGAFEGGGYVGEGFYRPTLNSIMHRFFKEEGIFYLVNAAWIERVIRVYSD